MRLLGSSGRRGWVLLIVATQCFIERGALALQLNWPLEERFGSHGEELRLIGCSIMVQNTSGSSLGLAAQALEVSLEHRAPGRECSRVGKARDAVRPPTCGIQLVGEFMENDVLTVGWISRSGHRAVPREDDHPMVPGLSERRVLFLGIG